mmetsp:Transcript_56183/g.154930  ORF Transcript_56183/g.154930 Transcript_56183/m.154930 type:complete len:218 (-) Transcript_56183:439-1092(-)
MLPYTRNFELNSAATGSRSRGMGAEDQKVFESVRAGKVRTAEQRRAAAFKLVNYPWVRIIKTQALLWDHDITFGATPTNNDIQYHWLTIACAKSVSFMPIDSPVVHHNYYKSRAQITSSRTPQRIQVIDAVLQTHRRLVRHGGWGGPNLGSRGNTHSRLTVHVCTHAGRNRFLPRTRLRLRRRRRRRLRSGTRLGSRGCCHCWQQIELRYRLRLGHR